MKPRCIAPLILLISMLLWNTSHAHCDLTVAERQLMSTSAEVPSGSLATPYFDIRVCLNAGFVSVCVVLRCDLHWTDILQPGLGQLFGHEGCKVAGQVTGPTPQSVIDFEGTEGMIQAIETTMNVPKGTLESFQVTLSPTFPLPDGNAYRVVAKTYPILKGTSGRYLPLEVEAAK